MVQLKFNFNSTKVISAIPARHCSYCAVDTTTSVGICNCFQKCESSPSRELYNLYGGLNSSDLYTQFGGMIL